MWSLASLQGPHYKYLTWWATCRFSPVYRTVRIHRCQLENHPVTAVAVAKLQIGAKLISCVFSETQMQSAQN